MGEHISLNAADGHTFSTYCADPPVGAARAGVVVAQEIFGVNGHIQAICDEFAACGFRAVAPALFDRRVPGATLPHDEAGMERGRALRCALGWTGPLLDIDAARNLAASAGRVGIVGYGWGGTLAWLAACRLHSLAAAACYYGAEIVEFKDENPKCPTVLHFGARDPLIPPRDVQDIADAHPDLPVVVHAEVGHGFNRDAQADPGAAAARAANARTLALFEETLVEETPG